MTPSKRPPRPKTTILSPAGVEVSDDASGIVVAAAAVVAAAEAGAGVADVDRDRDRDKGRARPTPVTAPRKPTEPHG